MGRSCGKQIGGRGFKGQTVGASSSGVGTAEDVGTAQGEEGWGLRARTFIDLKEAFYSIDQLKLWKKQAATAVLQLIVAFYSKMESMVYSRISCALFSRFLIQECLLSPLLFDIFRHDLKHVLTENQFLTLMLLKDPVPTLLYADNALLIAL